MAPQRMPGLRGCHHLLPLKRRLQPPPPKKAFKSQRPNPTSPAQTCSHQGGRGLGPAQKVTTATFLSCLRALVTTFVTGGDVRQLRAGARAGAEPQSGGLGTPASRGV